MSKSNHDKVIREETPVPSLKKVTELESFLTVEPETFFNQPFCINLLLFSKLISHFTHNIELGNT